MTADEAMNLIFETFGNGCRIKQWGDFFDTEIVRVEETPPTILQVQRRYDQLTLEEF